jgi:hypothetical protein
MTIRILDGRGYGEIQRREGEAARAVWMDLAQHLLLATMASIGMPLIVDWAHINRRWRDIDGRRRRVIDGRRRSDIHRLRCECVAHNGSDTKS